MEIVLGSKSIRRRELLELIGYDFVVDYVDIDEDIKAYKDHYDYVRQVVEMKTKAISSRHKDKLIICADTIVVVDDLILGKPKNKEAAREMIGIINDRSHKVITGCSVKYKDYSKIFIEETEVFIDKITDDEIAEYINTDEPYDKSGGYAIQGMFGKHVKKINGDFYNVMGLPINKLNNEIKEIKNRTTN